MQEKSQELCFEQIYGFLCEISLTSDQIGFDFDCTTELWQQKIEREIISSTGVVHGLVPVDSSISIVDVIKVDKYIDNLSKYILLQH